MKHGVFVGAVVIARVCEPKAQITEAGLGLVSSWWRRHVDAYQGGAVGGHGEGGVGLAFDAQDQWRAFGGGKREGAGVAVFVAQADLVGVADGAIGQGHEGWVAHRGDGDIKRAAHEQRHDQQRAHPAPQRSVEDRAQAEDVFPRGFWRVACAFAGFVGQGDIVDQAAVFPNFVHHVIAGVDAQGAGDAFHLLAFADVDAHGADVDAGHAVDAVAVLVCFLFQLAARLSAPIAVGDGKRVFVHHRRLDARPWAGVDADLLARVAAEEKRGGGEDRQGGIGHRMGAAGDKILHQSRRISEIEDPSAAGGEADQQPEDGLGDAQAQFAEGPFLLMMQTQARVAVAFDPAFHQDEQIGPHGLRASVTAPDAAQRGGE